MFCIYNKIYLLLLIFVIKMYILLCLTAGLCTLKQMNVYKNASILVSL